MWKKNEKIKTYSEFELPWISRHWISFSSLILTVPQNTTQSGERKRWHVWMDGRRDKRDVELAGEFSTITLSWPHERIRLDQVWIYWPVFDSSSSSILASSAVGRQRSHYQQGPQYKGRRAMSSHHHKSMVSWSLPAQRTSFDEKAIWRWSSAQNGTPHHITQIHTTITTL